MSRICSICVHPDRQRIEQERLEGRSKRQIAVSYAVSPDAVQRHHAHIAPGPVSIAPANAPDDSQSHQTRAHIAPHVVRDLAAEVSTEAETPMSVLKRGLPYIQQAVRLAGDDRLEQERLVAVLNEALMDSQMGL